MSKAAQLYRLLQQEETLLKQRKFADLEKLAVQKERLSAHVEKTAPAEMLEKIQRQAQKNADLFQIILAAAKGLRARFTELGKATGTVAYRQDGVRLSFGDEKSSRRV